MKTRLTKKQKVTELFYNAKDLVAEIHTHDAKLKKRLLAFAAEYPELCGQTDDDGQGGLWFEVTKERLSIRLTAPPTLRSAEMPLVGLQRKSTLLRIHNKVIVMKKDANCAFYIDRACMEI